MFIGNDLYKRRDELEERGGDVVNHPCNSQPFFKAGDDGMAMSTLVLQVQTLLQLSSSAGTPVIPSQFTGGSLAGRGWRWEWDTRGQGTTPATPAHGPGASLGRVSLLLFSTPSIVLGGSLWCRWPPGTSIPGGPVPILGCSRPAGGSRVSPCRSAGDRPLRLSIRVAVGRGLCSGDEGDLLFPIVTGGQLASCP